MVDYAKERALNEKTARCKVQPDSDKRCTLQKANSTPSDQQEEFAVGDHHGRKMIPNAQITQMVWAGQERCFESCRCIDGDC
jgi:hypothetical protein